MGISRASRRLVLRWFFVIVVVLSPNPLKVAEADPEQVAFPDCGTNALFVLHRLENRSITLDKVTAVLPTRHPKGYSMRELSTASRSLGIDLEGVHFGNGDKALTRPAIAFVEDKRGGHYAVLRPLGTTGTMVQLIDPPHAPWITDYATLFSSRNWTGRILIPRGTWWTRYTYFGILAVGGALLLTGLWAGGRMCEREQESLMEDRYN